MGRMACVVTYEAVTLDDINHFYDWMEKNFSQTEFGQNTYITENELEEIIEDNPKDAEIFKVQIAQLKVLIAKYKDFELDLS